MSFRSVFIAVVIAFALILAAFLINRARPKVETDQPGADFVRASGKCAECHARLQYSVVHEYEMSKHAAKGVNCLECHQPAQRAGEEGSSRICDCQRATDGGKLPQLPRTDLPAVPAQPARGAVLGGDLWREGADAGAGEFFGDVSAGRDEAAAASVCGSWRAGRRWPADASSATASASRIRMARSAPARRATRGTPVRSRSRACRAPAGSATWGRIIRRSRSMKSRSTA